MKRAGSGKGKGLGRQRPQGGSFSDDREAQEMELAAPDSPDSQRPGEKKGLGEKPCRTGAAPGLLAAALPPRIFLLQRRLSGFHLEF